MNWRPGLAFRLALIFITGWGLAYGLSISLQAWERSVSSRSVTHHYQLSENGHDVQLTINVTPAPPPTAGGRALLLLIQSVILLVCTWLAVRLAMRSLTRAIDDLTPNDLQERMQRLAAISHDLQTPITRMKLRLEVMNGEIETDKLWRDLSELEHLAREGVAYARSMDSGAEPICRVRLDAFLDSLIFDYQDSGARVERHAIPRVTLETRPHALRRVLVNLLDNALKFSGTACVDVSAGEHGASIRVLDNGPGIPDDQLLKVLQPFYRLEGSRNSDTVGSGLGLAIAQQLTQALGGTLTLSNRPEGGLCARIDLP